MKVHELKKIVKLTDVHELSPDHRYIIRLPRNTSQQEAAIVWEQLKNAKVNALLMVGDDIKIYDMGEFKPL